MAQPTAPDRSRSRLDQRSALAGAAREGRGSGARRALPGSRSTRSSTRWRRPSTPQAEALARLAHEETGYGVVADKVQKNLFAFAEDLQVHPADEDGRRHPPHRGPEGHRDRRALRRRGRDCPVDEPDIHRDLQDPDLAQGALPDRDQPASVRGPLHHARRRDHERGGASAPARRTARSTG